MSTLDWIVLLGTLGFIIIYGIWKSRGAKDMEGYLKGNTMPWYAVGLSIMATQASAITFLSAPGQAYTDGMRFVQFYFGLPIAMIILSVTVVPIYHRLKVYTAYEFLESRFDLRTRALAAFLFLIQRGLAAGLTIYAPAIIISSLLGWNIYYTNVFIGGMVILYTVAGGTRAVSYTQMQQMAVIFLGMFLAGYMVVHLMPDHVSFIDAVKVAGKTGKLNVIDFDFDLKNRYNIWSGLIGGLFLALSYFGTDQSQVARYLSGKSIAQSRLGLLFNGLIKIPMQFLILLIGSLLFVFYQFERPPIFFNKVETEKLAESPYAENFNQLENAYTQQHDEKRAQVELMVEGFHNDDDVKIEAAQQNIMAAEAKANLLRKEAIGLMEENDKSADTNDTNYIFLSFVMKYLPAGLIGLLIAVILSASMSSTSSELNALASTTVVDIYKRLVRKEGSDKHFLNVSRAATFMWGIYAIFVAQFANQLGSLIEAVNQLGSLFYGTILGIFLVAFYFKKIQSQAVFFSALLAEVIVIVCYVIEVDIAYLWYNFIGCALVILFAHIWQFIRPVSEPAEA